MQVTRVLYGIIALIVLLIVISTIMAKREAAQRPYDWLFMSLTEPETLNPVLMTDVSAWTVNFLVMEPMVMRNRFTFEYEPALAESWEISDDKLEFTFHLRKGVKWHDGSEFTSDDVAYTYEKVAKDEGVRATGRPEWANCASFEIIDKYTVRFRWKTKYFRAFGMCAEMMIIPRKAFGDAEGEDFNQHEMGRGCVGTGPYKMVKWETGKKMVLERNDNHWKKEPFFKEVHFIMVSEPSAALEMFKKGEIDVCGVSDVAWTKLTNSRSFKKRFIKYNYPTFAYSYITWNNKRVFFKDKRVRRAMTHLVDRQKFIETIMFGMAEVVTGPFYPTSQAYNHDIEPLEYDPERAKALLDEAGWIDRDGDGIRENEDGVKFEFEFLVRNSPTSQKIATILQEELRKVGIVMKQRSLEWAIFLKYLYERNFDATTLGEKLGVDVGLHGMWHSSGAEYDVSANFSNYVNKEVDRLIKESRAEFDEQERYAILREAHRIIHEEQPFTFLMSGKNKVLINKRLVNVRYSAEGTLVEEWRAVPWDKIDYSQPWLREQ